MVDFWVIFFGIFTTLYIYDRYKAALRQIRLEELIRQDVKKRQQSKRLNELYGREDETR